MTFFFFIKYENIDRTIDKWLRVKINKKCRIKFYRFNPFFKKMEKNMYDQRVVKSADFQIQFSRELIFNEKNSLFSFRIKLLITRKISLK